MDLKKKLKELKPQQLNCNVFDVYSYNGLTMQDLLCQFFTTINECVKSTNEVIDLTDWLVDIGLEEEVVKKLMVLIEDGTVEKLINVNLFKTLNNEINGLSSQLEQKANIEDVVNISSGTPLFANSTSEMTDTTRNYVNITDGYLYNYSDGQWVKTTILYQSSGIADKSIGTKETMYLMAEGEQSKNLFNKDTVIKGKQVNYINGVVDENIETCASDYISVDSGEEYILTHFSTGSDIAFYNSDNVFVSGIGSAAGAFIVPLEATKLRLTTRLTNLDTQQLEKGNVRTEYTNYYPKAKICENSIKNEHLKGGITKDKLDFNVLDLQNSTNLFNKDTVTKDSYVNYLTGKVETVSGFSVSDFIEVLSDTTYTKKLNHQMAFYDENETFISGLLNPTTFTTPSNCKYIRICFPSNMIEDYMLNVGETLLNYETYYKKIKSENFGPNTIPKSALAFNINNNGNIIVVDKNGNGDYTSINEALSNINDSIDNKYLLVITPGVYEESVKLIGRYVTIVGVNREECIIKTTNNDYLNPPVDLSCNSHLVNLTIISTKNTPVNLDLGSYAVHFDIAGRYSISDEKYQGKSLIKNCKLISENSSALGIGLSSKQHLIVEDSEIYSPNGYSLILHTLLLAGGVNQKATFKRNIIHNDDDNSVIQMYDANHSDRFGGEKDCYDTIFEFIDNNIYSELRDDNLIEKFDTPSNGEGLITGYVKLGKSSYGNRLTELNY